MPMDADRELGEVARRARSVGDVGSAAIFVVDAGSGAPHLAAAAGIAGPALDGLVAAVRDPAHPVARALTDDGPTFDVPPVNPGGPKLRSHLPLRVARQGVSETVGVLAVAHDAPLGAIGRDELIGLAAEAASLIGH